uniref:carbon starvation CstA family protein n=1 Tax=Salmonella enterica TaxID=28901 RepID=UPI00398C77C9
MNKTGKDPVWAARAVLGAFALGCIALTRGEQINAIWSVVASVCVYPIAYRFYGPYVSNNARAVSPTRTTPAVRPPSVRDASLTAIALLFGRYLAAMAVAGPLVR